MFSWLKRLLSTAKDRKKFNDEVLANLPVEHASNSNELPLDPKNDPFGRR